MDSLQGEQFCPRCAAELVSSSESDGTAGSGYACPACGLLISAADLAEFDYLLKVEAHAVAKRQWIIDVAASGGQAVAVAQGPPQTGQPVFTAGPPSGPTAAGCLLATGVFALFAAALTFTAFAWDAFGALGQLMVLVLAGVGSLVGGYRLSRRLEGTANALSVAGVLLLVVAAGFLIDADSIGSPYVRAAVVAGAAIGLVASSYIQARRQPGAAVVTATIFSFLALVTALAAPAVGRDDDPDWFLWWVAVVPIVWGACLLVNDLMSSQRAWRRVPWAGLGVIGFVFGVAMSSFATIDALSPREMFSGESRAIRTAIVVVGAMALLLIDRLSRARWFAMPVGSMVLLLSAGLVLASALDDPSARRWSAAAGLILFAGLVAAAAHVRARPSMSTQAPTGQSGYQLWAGALVRLAAITIAGSLALLLSPWGDAPGRYSDTCLTSECVNPSYVTWLTDSYPWWLGVLTGVVATVAAGFVVVLMRLLKREGARDLPVLVGVGILALWSLILGNAATGFEIDGSVVQPAATAALVIGGLGLLVTFWAGRSHTWALWIAAGIAAAGGQVAWMWLDLQTWSIGPELHGAFVGVPLLLAGMIILLSRPDEAVSTWVSVGPALFAALVFPVVAVVDDAFTRGGAEIGFEEAVRLVAVLVVCSVLVVLGARNHWASPFWSGLIGIVIVTGSQLLDLASLLPQWVSLAIVGVILLVAGARWESVRLRGRRTRQWAGNLR